MAVKVRREFKNSVFIDMFGQETYLLQLFQTLHPEMTDVTVEDIETITLKQVITNHPYNDLAFLVRDRLMIFVEAQSTWSINILLRILLYLADTIQEYLHQRQIDIHDVKRIALPEPEFYVIYTGKEPAPETITLRGDFFESGNVSIDLTARVYAAETEDIIGQYIIFCRVLDDQIRKYGKKKEAAQEAIRICQDRGVLTNYLKDREKEVVDIMIMLFDQDYAEEMYGNRREREGFEKGKEEGREEGIEQGMERERISSLKRIMRKMKYTMEEAMEFMEISPEDRKKLAPMLKEAESEQYTAMPEKKE